MSKILKKTLTRWRPMILSRHPSHAVLRLATKNLPALPVKSCVRFGSTTDIEDTVSNGGRRIEINSIQSIKNSANKLLMKEKFMEVEVKTAKWCKGTQIINISDTGISYTINNTTTDQIEFPIVAKAHFGSKGRGNTLIRNMEEYHIWSENKTLSNYIFEKFMNYAYEYRLHITYEGCFYACRKALKQDVPEDQKWRRHDDICVWFLEENPNFFKPNSWDDIVSDCVNALEAIGADILSFDVKVQSPRNKDGDLREYQEYILLECNSASSMDNGTGELSVCAKKYIEELPKVIMKKASIL